MNFHETDLGFVAEAKGFQFFFGKKSSSLANLETAFPAHKFRRIRQTHSDLVRPADEELHEADAHWSKASGEALLISTADCLPVLFADPASGLFASVHAGWRGVANRILVKTIDVLLANGASASSLMTVIGPHIGPQSFQVGRDVRDLLLASAPGDNDSLSTPDGEEKFRVQLLGLVHQQLDEKKLQGFRHELALDTMKEGAFHSHRRDREKAGRQLSFVGYQLPFPPLLLGEKVADTQENGGSGRN